jgi:hypothetical protein
MGIMASQKNHVIDSFFSLQLSQAQPNATLLT